MAGLFSRAATWLAGAFSRSQVVQTIAIVDPPPLYLQHTRIGGGLTPQDVSAIFGYADNGYMSRLCDLGNESRQKDAHLQSVLGTRELAVALLPHYVTPAKENDKKDKLVADWTTEWMANFGADLRAADSKPKDLHRLISHMQGANFFGYANSETLFAKDSKYLIPIGCEPIAPRRFAFDLEHGSLRFWDETGAVPYPGTDLAEAFPGRFVQHQPFVNGDVESREGLIRVLIWMALFRNWDLGDWLKLAEIAWKPWRIGTYKKDATKEDIAALVKAAQSLTTNGVAVVPETVELAISWAKNRGDSGHAALAAMLAAEMSKATLGATLGVEPSANGGGAYALGKEHTALRHDYRDADAMAVSATIRRDLIAPAVRLNFGPDVAIPKFELRADETVDISAFSTGIKNLTDSGLDIPQAWTRKRVGIPDPKPGDELVGGRVYAIQTGEQPQAQPPKLPPSAPPKGPQEQPKVA